MEGNAPFNTGAAAGRWRLAIMPCFQKNIPDRENVLNMGYEHPAINWPLFTFGPPAEPEHCAWGPGRGTSAWLEALGHHRKGQRRVTQTRASRNFQLTKTTSLKLQLLKPSLSFRRSQQCSMKGKNAHLTGLHGAHTDPVPKVGHRHILKRSVRPQPKLRPQPGKHLAQRNVFTRHRKPAFPKAFLIGGKGKDKGQKMAKWKERQRG